MRSSLVGFWLFGSRCIFVVVVAFSFCLGMLYGAVSNRDNGASQTRDHPFHVCEITTEVNVKLHCVYFLECVNIGVFGEGVGVRRGFAHSTHLHG